MPSPSMKGFEAARRQAFPWFLKEKGSEAIPSDKGKNLPRLNQTMYS
jgi:hypothetical protein